jgi:hypothetical protein
MDPHSGKLYPSLDAAKADGVADPILLEGPPAELERVSRAVAHYSAVTRGDKSKRRAANKVARKARRAGRR